MKPIKSLLTFLLLFATGLLYSQVPIVPDQFRVNLEPGEFQEEMGFYQMKYRTNTLDMRKLGEVTGFQFPDSVVIVPPDLSRFDHTVVLVGVSGKQEDPNMVIWLAGNYNYKNITFFVDFNQDRNFVNDRSPIRMQAGEEPREILLTPAKGGDKKFYLTVPEVEVKRLEKYKIKIANRFAFALSMGVGSGDISYQYHDLTIGFPTWYYVNITEKNISAALTYDWRKFNLGVSASFQNHFYFTSHLDIQRGEPFTLVILDRTIYRDNIQRNKNVDAHNSNRFQWGIFGSYKLAIGRAVDLLPTVRYGQTMYFVPEYNRFIMEDNQVYPLKNSPFYEIALKTEFTIGIERAIYIELARNQQQWEPIGFLDDTPHKDFESSSIIWKVNVGFRGAINLFGKK